MTESRLYGQTPTLSPPTDRQRAQWAQDEAWDTRMQHQPSFTVSARRTFVNADEFRRVTVRDNETGEETSRDYLPNLVSEREAMADAFGHVLTGEGRKWLA